MDVKTQKRLQRVLECAYNEVPYFNNVINSLIEDTDEISPELFSKLPVFDKQTIRRVGWLNFVSLNYLNDKYKVVLDRGVHLERTSGTSGTPMQILWNNNDYHSSCRNHWAYRLKKASITPSSRMCTSSKSIPGNKLYYINESKNTLYFDIKQLDETTIPEILKGIYDYQPEWLYMQNSILYILVYYAEKMGLRFPSSIKYIEYMGEPICNFYRRKIEQAIPCVSSNMYGCVETNGISYECSEGHNHLLPDNVIVEIIDNNGIPVDTGKDGFVCVTGLHNTAMPIIRYRLNDIANIDVNTKCACGNPNPIINIKAARMPEYLILDDLSVFDEAELFCPINSGLKLIEENDGDILFNLKMNSLDNYDIQIYRGKQKKLNVDEILHRIFEAYELPNIKFSVQYIDKINDGKPAGILRLK